MECPSSPSADPTNPLDSRSTTFEACIPPPPITERQACWNCENQAKDSSSPTGNALKMGETTRSSSSSLPDVEEEVLKQEWEKNMKIHNKADLLASFVQDSSNGNLFSNDGTNGGKDSDNPTSSRRHAKPDPLAFVLASKAMDPTLAEEN